MKTPVFERSVVRVDEVDPTKREVHVVDKTGATFKVSYRSTSSTFQIPQQGERWIVERHGWQWHLEQRIDRGGTEADFTESLDPGDVHLRVPGTLHIGSNTIQIAGQPFGASTRDTILPDGVKAAYDLSSTPVDSELVMVYKNGLYLHDGTDYTISGTTITFASVPLTTDKIAVHYQHSGQVNRDADTIASIAEIAATSLYNNA